MRQTRIEQVGKFYQQWTSRDVKYAAEDLEHLTGSLLLAAEAEWTAGLQAHGWSYAQAVRFLGDVRRHLAGRSPLYRLEE